MRNSEKFLSYFNKIEEVLRKRTNLPKEESFSSIVRNAAKWSLVKYYQDDLIELADLRNAIVHKYKDGIILAEPNETAVNLIKKIYEEITQPRKILSIVSKKPVYTAKEDDSLSEVIKVMDKENYSQVPIYDNGGNFLGLLTENGITHWLGRNIKEDIFSLQETKVGEVLKYEENPNNYRFFSKNETIYGALEVFNRNIENPKEKVQAILITDKGDPSEKLLGIVTVWDMPKIWEDIKLIKN